MTESEISRATSDTPFVSGKSFNLWEVRDVYTKELLGTVARSATGFSSRTLNGCILGTTYNIPDAAELIMQNLGQERAEA